MRLTSSCNSKDNLVPSYASITGGYVSRYGYRNRALENKVSCFRGWAGRQRRTQLLEDREVEKDDVEEGRGL